MTEQLYRVCWRTYWDDGEVLLRQDGRAFTYPAAMLMLESMKTTGRVLCVNADYWLEPV